MAQRALIGAADGVSISTASAVYYAPLGCGPAPGTILVTTEANVEHVHRGADVVLKRMYTRVQTNGRSTASTVTIRKNAAGTALLSSIGAAVTGTLSNLSDTVTLTAGDRYCVEVALGTGTGNLLITGITLAMEAVSQCIFPITGAGSQALVNASVTRYQTPAGPLGGVQSTETIVQIKALVPGALSNHQVYTTANGSTNATTAKSRLNAADGVQTHSITAAATGRTEDTTHSDTIAVGDLYDPAFVTGAGTASLTHSLVAFTFTPSVSRQSQLNSRTATSVLAASTTRYSQLMGRCAFNATEGNVQIVVPFACKLTGLTGKNSANASTTTVTAQLRINGSSVNNTTTFAGGVTGFSTASASVDYAQAGDLIDVVVSGADGNVTFQGFSILVEELVEFTATGLTVSSPGIDTPAVAQIHAVTATGLTTSSPGLGSPVIAQVQALAASELVTGSPILGTPVLAAVADLTATSLTVSSPILGTPVLGVVVTTVATALTTASPVLGTPALGVVVAVAATGLTVGSPVLGTPPLSTGGTDGLTASSLTTSSPSFGSPVLGQKHTLAASGLTTSSPSIGSAVVAAISNLSADPIIVSSPVFGSPAVGQFQPLVAAGLTTGSPILGVPAYALVPRRRAVFVLG